MYKCSWDNCTQLFLVLRDSCVIAFARIIQLESAQENSQSKMDTQTAGYQNKSLGAVAQTDYTGGLDCLRRRLSFVLTGTHLPVFDNYLKC